MRHNDLGKLGDVYGSMLNTVKKGINESVKNLDDKDPLKLDKGGPTKKGGYNKALHDSDDTDCEEEDNEEFNDTESEDDENTEEEVMESTKISKPRLNTTMKKQISSFDAIYKKVLTENFGMDDDSDIDALGLGDATPDSDLEGDFGGDDEFGGEEDSVTITIDRSVAQTLVDLLQGVLGGEEDLGGEGEIEDDSDLNFDDSTEEDNEGFYDEDEETTGAKTAPDKKKVFQSKNNKVGGKVKPHGGKASSDVTDDVGEDGDFGHAISSPKKPNMGTQNKVSNIKQGQELFK